MTDCAKGRIFKRSGGCSEDCFHCPYPDCYKPAQGLKTGDTEKIMRSMGGQGSQVYSRMFTVELGGRGTNTPNLSRKFYL